MARPQNPSSPPPASPSSRVVWLLWLAVAAVMITLGLTLPRWWFHLRDIQPPFQPQQEQIAPSSEGAATIPPRLGIAIAGIIPVWMLIAWLVVWRKSRSRGPSSQAPPEHYRLAELVLPCGCWLQLIHLGERRLLAGHDRTGIRVLLELPPAPAESELRTDGLSEPNPPLSCSPPEQGATDSRTASILALFLRLKAATQASS